MPRTRATSRASPADSAEQQLPNRLAGSADSRHGHTRRVTPTTSYPCSTSRAAATEESTPPLMPTTMRCMTAILPLPQRQKLREAFQLFGVRVGDFDFAPPTVADDDDAGLQRALEGLLERGQLGRVSAATSRRPTSRRGLLAEANRVLGGPHGPVVGQDLVAELELVRSRVEREEGARVAHRQSSRAEIGLDRLGQAKEAERIRDRGPVTTDSLRQLILSPAELVEEVPVGLGLLHRVQVLSEEIFDQGELQAFGVARLSHDGRNTVEAGLPRGAPTPLAGDQLIAASGVSDEDRLDHPRYANRG